MRGAPGAGKSTWIEKNGLKPYTLCADDIRILCQSPVMQVNGTEGISQKNDGVVWDILFKLLEVRMQKGEFTVIDATNSKTKEMNRYKELCMKYRYRIYCVDFTDIPKEEVKKRNAERIAFKRVPEDVIDRFYSRLLAQKVPSGIKVIKPDELDSIWLKLFDFSDYKRIHHIGDIHGCNTVLQKYLSDNGGIKDDEMYIFTGDFIDRGLENVEVLNFLISIMNKKNVLMLEGNHERWLWLWSNDEIGNSKEFELITRTQLNESGISKKDIRQLYRKLGQCAWYKYGDKEFLVTHGGLSTVPENLSFVATEQMIKGVGDYNDAEQVANTFANTANENIYQIHGHRNKKGLPVNVNDRVYNLEGRVEYGGQLRCVQVDNEGIHVVEVQNDVFKTPEMKAAQTVTDSSIANQLIALRGNPYIREKRFGNISSFNFTAKAFYDKAWDEQTIKARGLYIDTLKGKIVARSYEKFFNINERPETKFDMLEYKLQFPVTAYVKENGFLGIVGYDEYEDELLITSKSTIGSPAAQYLKNMIYEKLSLANIMQIKEYIKEHDVSFVFECVDMKNDPHVIEYPESKLVLLDVVYNKMSFEKIDYDDLVSLANNMGLCVKERAYVINNWQEFFDWYFMVLEPEYEFNGGKIEGFVLEDSAGFMTKLKLTYYNFWKFMRSIAEEVIRTGYTVRTSALTSVTANEFYAWIKEYRANCGDISSIPRDICSLRKMFYDYFVAYKTDMN